MRYNHPICRRLFFILLSVLVGGNVFATHYRAGEITYEVVSGRQFKFTINSYTDPTSQADISTVSIDIDWGDQTTTPGVKRDHTESYTNVKQPVRKNVYYAYHTFATDGVFEIGFTDHNRVKGIKNINGGNTSDLAFFVSCIINVSSSIGNNSSPFFTNPPIDWGCIGSLYIYNPMGFDPDGDSLVYKLIPPKIAPGEDVPFYSNPSATDSFSLNSRTGRIYWDKTIEGGFYNIAIQVTEYRNSDYGPPIIVGQVVRDMQIFIDDKCTNDPPKLNPQPDVCLRVGKEVSRTITASDPNPGQRVTIDGVSEPFYFNGNPATLSPRAGVGTNGTVANFGLTLFRWTPFCNNIRFEPFQIGFDAFDDDPTSALDDYNGFFVYVIGPEPTHVQVKQKGNDFFGVSWHKDSCELATRYDVYRRIDSSHWNPDDCQKGIPAYTGFLKIGSKNAALAPDDTVFIDNDKGVGLSPLIRYCYRVVSIFPARNHSGAVIGGRSSESYASAEVCNVIIRNKPIITKASVNYTDSLLGSVQLSWLKPDTLDTSSYKPPYKMVFKHGYAANSLAQFAESSYDDFHTIPDSTMVDTMLNTSGRQYFYAIELHAQFNGADVKVDVSPTASTVWAMNYATDNTNILSWKVGVPWINDTFVVYRKNDAGVYNEVARTIQASYADTGLINNKTYTYVIQSLGQYPLLPLRISNFSQEIKGTPVDTVPPCPPLLVVVPPCNDYTHYENILSWTTDLSCANDVVKFNIYYKLEKVEGYELLATVSNTTFTYTDAREVLKKSIAGCYVVTGVDSFNNESSLQAGVCIDNCPDYRLPNVFTPNTDGFNDLFRPFQYRFIDHINLNIYNRWGDQVFHTQDLDIKWNGTDQNTGKELSEGVYFYTCEVYEQYLDALRKRTIKGTVQIMR